MAVSARDEDELRLILMHGRCPVYEVDRIRAQLFRFGEGQIKDQITNPEVSPRLPDVKQLKCLVDAIIFAGRSFHDQNIGNIRIHEIIRELQVLAEGGGGAVFSAGYGNEKNLFTIKTPHFGDSLVHETAAGLLVLNAILEHVPNFMATYGLFFCSAPIVNSDNVVVDWCEPSTSPVSYVVNENIIDGKSVYILAETLSADDVLILYLQVVNALRVAHSMNDFTHHDLHDDNVLIQKYVTPISIPYYGSDRKKRWLNTNYLAKIIDYGASHFKFLGRDFGMESANYSFPMNDCYRFLRSIYNAAMYHRRQDIIDVAKKIFDFFKEMVGGVDFDTRYDLPLEHREVSFETFLRYIEKIFPIDTFTTNDPLYFPMQGTNNMSLTDFMKKLSMKDKPVTLFEYYQTEKTLASTTLAGYNRDVIPSVRALLRRNFDATLEFDRMFTEVSREFISLRNFKETFSLLPLKELLNVSKFIEYTDSLIKLAQFRGTLGRIFNQIEISRFVIVDLNLTPIYGDRLDEIIREANEMKIFYDELARIVRMNNEVIEKVPALQDPDNSDILYTYQGVYHSLI